ncbi:hypothetical protein V6N13_088544 [Hibiscus sabdariffa]
MGPLEDINAKGNRLVDECRRAFSRQAETRCAHPSDTCWKRPSDEWIKVNVDATISTSDSTTSIGVVFHDNKGRWLYGVARSIGRCNVLLAELWGNREGLLHAWSCSYRHIAPEPDSLKAVRIFTSVSTVMKENGLVLSIKRWLNRGWQVRVQHVGHGYNRVADKMAARGRESMLTTTIFTMAPDNIRDLIGEEMVHSAPARGSLVREGVVPFDPGGS